MKVILKSIYESDTGFIFIVNVSADLKELSDSQKIANLLEKQYFKNYDIKSNIFYYYDNLIVSSHTPREIWYVINPKNLESRFLIKFFYNDFFKQELLICNSFLLKNKLPRLKLDNLILMLTYNTSNITQNLHDNFVVNSLKILLYNTSSDKDPCFYLNNKNLFNKILPNKFYITAFNHPSVLFCDDNFPFSKVPIFLQSSFEKEQIIKSSRIKKSRRKFLKKIGVLDI